MPQPPHVQFCPLPHHHLYTTSLDLRITSPRHQIYPTSHNHLSLSHHHHQLSWPLHHHLSCSLCHLFITSPHLPTISPSHLLTFPSAQRSWSPYYLVTIASAFSPPNKKNIRYRSRRRPFSPSHVLHHSTLFQIFYLNATFLHWSSAAWSLWCQKIHL